MIIPLETGWAGNTAKKQPIGFSYHTYKSHDVLIASQLQVIVAAQTFSFRHLNFCSVFLKEKILSSFSKSELHINDLKATTHGLNATKVSFFSTMVLSSSSLQVNYPSEPEKVGLKNKNICKYFRLITIIASKCPCW